MLGGYRLSGLPLYQPSFQGYRGCVCDGLKYLEVMQRLRNTLDVNVIRDHSK